MAKNLQVAVEKISGLSQADSACAVFSKRVALADGSMGTIVSCILVTGNGESDISAVLTDIFELAVKKLEGSDDILATLKHILGATVDLLGERQLAVNFVSSFFYEGACYIARFGDKVKVFVFDGPKSTEITFEAGSGPTRGGQIYLIGTDAFLQIFDGAVFKEEVQVDFEEIIDGLATEISAKKNQAEIGAAFVQVREEEEVVGVAGEQIEVEEPGKEAVREENMAGQSDLATPSGHRFKFKNPLVALGRLAGRELRRLRHGDLRAILRLRRNIVLLSLVLILVLAGSVIWTLRAKNERAKQAEFAQAMATASSKHSQGTAIIELNRSRAREILIEADKAVRLALSIEANNQDAKSLLAEITDRLRETEVNSDLNFQPLVQLPGSAHSLAFWGRDLVAVGDSQLFEVNVEGGQISEIDGVAGQRGGFVFDNKAYVTTGQRVVRVDLAGGATSEVVSGAGGLDLSVFLGNVYLLYGERIDKFVPVVDGYLGPTAYLNSQEQFSEKSHLAIDGAVWVTSGNKVWQFVRGEKQDFEIEGLVGDEHDFSYIYTTASLNNLYVVDSLNSALLVIGRDGVLRRVYQSGEFGRASDLVVSESEDKIYLAVADKILEATLE